MQSLLAVSLSVGLLLTAPNYLMQFGWFGWSGGEDDAELSAIIIIIKPYAILKCSAAVVVPLVMDNL